MEAGQRRSIGVGVVLGLVSGGVAIGTAQVAAGIVNPQASPIITVGQTTIDLTPEWVKSFAIRAFGENDKLVLLGGIAIVLATISALLGIASIRRQWVGVAGLLTFGAVGVAAALSRPTGRWRDTIPVIVGVLAGLVALLGLRRSLFRSRRLAVERLPVSDGVQPPGLDRRRFLVAGALTAVGAVIAGGVGNALARRFRADASRAAVRIPAPASRAVSPSGVGLSVPRLGPFFTPNDRFYRVDTALLVPSVMAEDWKLRVHGMVDREITLDYEQLLTRPLIERDITLACVSNPVGGRYVGNARWIGAPLLDLLQEAGVHPGADQIVTTAIDGFTIGTPTAVAMDGRDAMLAVAMNGEPLPLAHGFPVRMIVPGLYGYVSATKWLVDMELTTFGFFDPYWVQRGWAEQAPIKTMSRIDTPHPFLELSAGEVPVAGVALAQHRGIERVEVQIDDRPWAEAVLAAEDTIDTWRQWVYRWDATPGSHRLSVRARDRDGETQTAERVPPFPDGATGLHTINVRVA
jgi:DMSO/TMAO reductase YedYZ molybdopterin-dependent catalytic subunit